MNRKRVLFICTHNASRSQMAEGFLRVLASDLCEAASAGTDPTQVHPLAVRAMAEIGVDLASRLSKPVDAFVDQPWDYVVTVCDKAREHCPVFPTAAHRLHWSFDDPSKATGTEEERLWTFRRIRDEIRGRIRDWLRDITAAGLVDNLRKHRLHIAPWRPRRDIFSISLLSLSILPPRGHNVFSILLSFCSFRFSSKLRRFAS